MIAGIDVAHWHGAIGGTAAWVYRNTPGNLAASAICVVGAWFWKGKTILAHLDELHRHHGIGKYKQEPPAK